MPTRLAVTSVAPHLRGQVEHPRIAEQIVSLLAPSSFAADQYRGLRHAVERLRAASALHVIGITSPAPGDGKTVTTLNLAGALAQSSDARVLVVDADLRRPSVSAYLGLSPRLPGLADAIAHGESSLTGLVRRLEGFNLSVLPAGTPTNAPYELLNSPHAEGLLAEARRHFDCIVVDTPPFVPLPDGRLIERWVDGFLVVVAAHKTPRRLLAEALKAVDSSKLVGIVFNADDRPASGYYGYYDNYYGASSGRSGAPWWDRLLNRRGRPAAR